MAQAVSGKGEGEKSIQSDEEARKGRGRPFGTGTETSKEMHDGIGRSGQGPMNNKEWGIGAPTPRV